MKSSDNTLAVKALNQYRKRDIIAYLNLRFYLDNVVARRSRWIEEVSSRLASEGESKGFLKTFHFKEIEESGRFVHREIYIPNPNESLAETALINSISKIEDFKAKPYVYSYRFTEQKDKSGTFQYYFKGFRQRQRGIAKACNQIKKRI